MDGGFLFKLGEFKAEQTNKGFTKIHNATYFAIAKILSPAACHLYTALSTYAYGSKVAVYIKYATLAKQLDVSKDTIVRWIRELERENIIRRVPQYTIDGAQTCNVLVFNAEFPEIPEPWHTFAENGFVNVAGQPMLREDYEYLQRELAKSRLFTSAVPPANLQGASYCPQQNQGGCDNTPNRFEEETSAFLPGGQTVGVEVWTSTERRFIQGEENNHNKTTEEIVVVSGLKEAFESVSGDNISIQKMQELAEQYGADKVHHAIDIVATKPEWPQGAEACLVAALRDDWKLPRARDNPNKLSQKRLNRGARTTHASARDPRYRAFYKLFPD